MLNRRFHLIGIFFLTVAWGLLILGLGGCGQGKQQETVQTDTIDFMRYVERGPDSNIYPLVLQVSSQRYPTYKYGAVKMFDGYDSTYWSAAQGLHIGEEVYMEFDALEAAQFMVKFSGSINLAKVTRMRVVVNDSVLGEITSGIPIRIPFPIQTLRITAVDSDGFNDVELPVDGDTTGLVRRIYDKFTISYNSKSLGIEEIKFIDQAGKFMPVKAIPVKEAEIAVSGIPGDSSGYKFFDGYTDPGIAFSPKEIGFLNLKFDKYTPVVKFRFIPAYDFKRYIRPGVFFNEIMVTNENIGKGTFVVSAVPGEYISKDTIVGKFINFRFPAGEGPFPGELQIFDGARYYTVSDFYNRSNYEEHTDHLKKTLLSPLINGRIFHRYKVTTLKTDTVKILNPQQIPTDIILSEHTGEIEMVLRASMSFHYQYKETVVQEGNMETFVTTTFECRGYWDLTNTSETSAAIKLEGFCDEIRETATRTSRRKKIPLVANGKVEGDFLLLDNGLKPLRISY